LLKNSAAPPLHGEVSITCKKERHEGRQRWAAVALALAAGAQ